MAFDEATEFERTLAKIETTLNALNPDEALDHETGWRERKSGRTRTAILNAATQCLASVGYAKTSTQLVARTAEVSRGAMLHHFATKLTLVSSVIDHIHYKRLRSYFDEIKKLTDQERIDEGAGIEIYWEMMKAPEFDAHMELCVASRTDPELQKIFDKKVRAFDKIYVDALPSVFPEWRDKSREDLQLAHDMIVTGLQGLKLNYRILAVRGRRQALRRFIFESVARLRDGD